MLNVHRVHRKKYIFSTGESPLFYCYGGRSVGAKAKTHGFTNVAHTTTLIDTATFYVCPENDPFLSKNKSSVTFGPNVGPIVVTQTQRRARFSLFPRVEMALLGVEGKRVQRWTKIRRRFLLAVPYKSAENLSFVIASRPFGLDQSVVSVLISLISDTWAKCPL